MTEQMELKTIPLSAEFDTLLEGYPEELSLALQQVFSPNYKEIKTNNWEISHYSEDETMYIMVENPILNTLYDIVITHTLDGKEIREVTEIKQHERNYIGHYLLDWKELTIKVIQLSDQNPNVEQP
jgi:hypothetical protein